MNSVIIMLSLLRARVSRALVLCMSSALLSCSPLRFSEEEVCFCVFVRVTLIEAVVGATGCAARDATYAGRAIWMIACVCARARVVREG